MSIIERALEALKPSGEPASPAPERERIVGVQSMKPNGGHCTVRFKPLPPAAAKMQVADDDAMPHPWDLKGNLALLPHLRKFRRVLGELISRFAKQGPAVDAMPHAWDLKGNPALFSQLRNIRRELERLLSQRGKQSAAVVAVTSALPGEGKSFLSLGLARALAAAQDQDVVLVDADLPKRHLTELLGTCDRSGLVECLVAGRALPDVLCRSDLPAMNFLPAGRWRSDAPDLICSANMDRILDSFRHYDSRRIFVIDTAPVLAFGETAYLAERSDVVVLVIRADQTPRAAAEEALRKLAADRPIALVLNGQQGSILDAYYGYGDSYGDYLPAKRK